MIEKIEEKIAACEAILFTMGDSVELDKIAKGIEASTQETEEVLEALALRYEQEGRGLKLITLDQSYQLCTKPEYYDALIRVASQPKRQVMTPVLLETLSIIAYRQPITKAEIEKIRGVKSDHAVNKLVEYELVREDGRLEGPGRPILFATTEEFLRRFGLSSYQELPVLDEKQEEEIKKEVMTEVNKAYPEETQEGKEPSPKEEEV